LLILSSWIASSLINIPFLWSSFLSLVPLVKDMLSDKMHTVSSEGAHRQKKCIAYCNELGEQRVHAIIEGIATDHKKRQILNHSDAHVFNILVEKKPSPTSPSSPFGPTGKVVFCDWEMAMVGPLGRDTGVFMAFPLASAFAHAAQGNDQAAQHIFETTVKFWTVYSIVMRDRGGKDDRFLLELLRSTLGWISFYLIVVPYCLRIHIEHLPSEGMTQQEFDGTVLESIGFVGILLGEYGFLDKDPDLTVNELLKRYEEILRSEIKEFLGLPAANGRHRPTSQRRASMLRESGRRVSDAGAMEQAAAAELVRRASASAGALGNNHSNDRYSRASALPSPADIEKLLLAED